jgi:hypothetical protein
MPPRWRIGEQGFCLRTRASLWPRTPSSTPQPQGRGHTLGEIIK